MNVRCRVDLSQSEREELGALVSGGKQPVRRLKRMQILLAADAGVRDEAIVASVQTSGSTIYRTKNVLWRSAWKPPSVKPRPGAARKLSGKEKVRLVALACSNPPEGCARWTLKLLAGALVELVEHQSISRETIRRRLDDNDLKPWQKKMWCIANIDGEYIARMEDLLVSMPSRMTPSDRSSALTKVGSSSLARCEYVSRQNPESDTATTPITSATALQTSLSWSTPTGRGARSRSLIGARIKTSPSARATWRISTIMAPTRSASSWIIYRPTRPQPFIRPFQRPRRVESCDVCRRSWLLQQRSNRAEPGRQTQGHCLTVCAQGCPARRTVRRVPR